MVGGGGGVMCSSYSLRDLLLSYTPLCLFWDPAFQERHVNLSPVFLHICTTVPVCFASLVGWEKYPRYRYCYWLHNVPMSFLLD